MKREPVIPLSPRSPCSLSPRPPCSLWLAFCPVKMCHIVWGSSFLTQSSASPGALGMTARWQPSISMSAALQPRPGRERERRREGERQREVGETERERGKERETDSESVPWEPVSVRGTLTPRNLHLDMKDLFWKADPMYLPQPKHQKTPAESQLISGRLWHHSLPAFWPSARLPWWLRNSMVS